MRVAGIQRATAAWRKTLEPMANFLISPAGEEDFEYGSSRSTNTPRVLKIAWLPAVHNSRTKALLEARRLKVIGQLVNMNQMPCAKLMVYIFILLFH